MNRLHYKYCPVCGKQFEEENNQLLICKHCGYHFYQTSKPTAGAVIVKKEKETGKYRVLLTKRGIEPYKGYWDIAGGFLQNGEQPEEGLRREIREELGTEIYNPTLFFAIADKYPREDIPVEASNTICLYYICSIDEKANLKAEDDITEWEWFDIENPPETIAFRGNKKALSAAIQYLKNHPV